MERIGGSRKIYRSIGLFSALLGAAIIVWGCGVNWRAADLFARGRHVEGKRLLDARVPDPDWYTPTSVRSDTEGGYNGDKDKVLLGNIYKTTDPFYICGKELFWNQRISFNLSVWDEYISFRGNLFVTSAQIDVDGINRKWVNCAYDVKSTGVETGRIEFRRTTLHLPSGREPIKFQLRYSLNSTEKPKLPLDDIEGYVKNVRYHEILDISYYKYILDKEEGNMSIIFDYVIRDKNLTLIDPKTNKKVTQLLYVSAGPPHIFMGQ